MRINPLARGCVAEFIGTFALVFFGAGSIIVVGHPDIAAPGGLGTIAAAHGLSLVVFVTACMYVSGAQFNPAVSIALILAGKQNSKTAAAYVGSQLLSAACAAGCLVLLLGRSVADHESVRLGATIGSLTSANDAFAVVGLEAIGAFALMFSILACVADHRAHKLGGVCVGLTLSMCILAIGPLTGASVNPARTFGPALYGHWDMHWAYWLGPVLGACAAAAAYRFVHAESVHDRSP